MLAGGAAPPAAGACRWPCLRSLRLMPHAAVHPSSPTLNHAQVAKEYLSRLGEPAVRARLEAGAAAGPVPLDGAPVCIS